MMDVQPVDIVAVLVIVDGTNPHVDPFVLMLRVKYVSPLAGIVVDVKYTVPV
jgi:hypothetical protein